MAITPFSHYELESNSNDSTGNYNGTDTNMSYVSGGARGNCGSFNGTNSYFTLASGFYDNIKARNDYWFSVWINPTSLTGGAVIYSYTAAADFYAYFSATGKIMMRRGATSNTETGTSVTAGSWQHFVFQYTSSTNVAIYKNGSFVQNITVAATPNTTTTFNFGKYFNTTFPYNGKMDHIDVGVGNLSAAEISQLYGSGTPPAYPYTNPNFLMFF